MKTLLLVTLLLFISKASFGQETANSTLFAQGLIRIDSPEELNALTESVRANPYVRSVRLDWNTKRVFVLTKDISQLSIESFKSWFGAYGDQLSCIQIGVYGIDKMNSFPFTDCEN